MRVAVVGHVEWTTIVRVGRLPQVGEISHTLPVWEGPAGGGAVAAVRVAALTGCCTLYTALGADPAGERTCRELAAHGVRVVAAPRRAATGRAVSFVDGTGERTTVTIGARLQPAATDDLPWDELARHDAVYFCAGDPGVLRHARRIRLLAVTTRELAAVRAAGVAPDVLVGSDRDPAERCDRPDLTTATALVVLTEGGQGGRYATGAGDWRRYPPVAPPAPLVDTYGVGDTFAAALTVALAGRAEVAEALARAARESAVSLTGPGPYPAGHTPVPTAAAPLQVPHPVAQAAG